MIYDYGTHECLDRTYLVMEMFSYVSEHPQVKASAEWTALADEAHTALWKLYQAIGNTSDAEGGPHSDRPRMDGREEE